MRLLSLCYTLTTIHIFLCYAAIFVGLSSLVYSATEGPNAVASVCATIEDAFRPLRRDTSVFLMTPVTGGAITGIII